MAIGPALAVITLTVMGCTSGAVEPTAVSGNVPTPTAAATPASPLTTAAAAVIPSPSTPTTISTRPPPVTPAGPSSPDDVTGDGSTGTAPAVTTTAAAAPQIPPSTASGTSLTTSATPAADDDNSASNELTPGRVQELPGVVRVVSERPPSDQEGAAGPAGQEAAVGQHDQDTNEVTSPCVPTVCGPNEICVPKTNKRYVCKCRDGYVKLPDDASHRHQCVPAPRTPVLSCNLHCGDHGYCQLGELGPQCVCTSPLLTGDHCERDRCAGYCANKGHCYQNLIDAAGQLSCACQLGWTGDRCETPVNPCSGGVGCMNGGSCSRTDGADVCVCAYGFTGRLCEQCQDHECHGNSTCHRSATTTQPVCQCAPGLSGDHCETGNCTEQLCRQGTCSMKNGDPQCTCDVGYEGVYCEMDTCHMYCKNDGSCARTAGGPQCRCGPRYGGRLCEVDLCTCSPGCQSDDCIACPPGTSRPEHLCGGGLALSCSDNSLLCLNGGTCEDTDPHDTGVCRCRAGYSGRHCEVGPAGGGACRAGLCLHGGSCQETATGAVCHCLTGWIGDRCGQPSSCKHYCFNGATCQLSPVPAEDAHGDSLVPTCHCPPGYVGLRCAGRVPGALASSGVVPSGSVVGGVAVAVGLIVILAIGAVIVWKRRRGKLFNHTRMRPDKLEVDNPMYLRDLESRAEADEGEEVEDAVFSLEEKPTNFSNPVYESTYPERDGASTSSEKTNLLPPENGRPSLTFSGTAPTDPLHDADA